MASKSVSFSTIRSIVLSVLAEEHISHKREASRPRIKNLRHEAHCDTASSSAKISVASVLRKTLPLESKKYTNRLACRGPMPGNFKKYSASFSMGFIPLEVGNALHFRS